MLESASIGIDVGGTKTRMALFDRKFKVIGDIKFKTPKTRRQFATALRESLEKFLKTATGQKLVISAAGVGFAGTIDHRKGRIKSAPNIPFLVGFSFHTAVQRVCRCDVVILNDVHAALYGELKGGRAVGYKDVVAIFIGTGIGGAIAVDGKLHFGHSGQAGDIGHYLLHALGPLAGSERHGVLDDVASRVAIAGAAATFAAKHWAPHLMKSVGTDVRSIKSSALAKAIRHGDKTIEELVRSRVQILGIVLSNIVDFLSPEMIVLGGGLTDAMPKIIRAEVEAGIQAHSSRSALRGLKIVTTKHKGHAVTIGSAMFARDHITQS